MYCMCFHFNSVSKASLQFVIIVGFFDLVVLGKGGVCLCLFRVTGRIYSSCYIGILVYLIWTYYNPTLRLAFLLLLVYYYYYHSSTYNSYCINSHLSRRNPLLLHYKPQQNTECVIALYKWTWTALTLRLRAFLLPSLAWSGPKLLWDIFLSMSSCHPEERGENTTQRKLQTNYTYNYNYRF